MTGFINTGRTATFSNRGTGAALAARTSTSSITNFANYAATNHGFVAGDILAMDGMPQMLALVAHVYDANSFQAAVASRYDTATTVIEGWPETETFRIVSSSYALLDDRTIRARVYDPSTGARAGGITQIVTAERAERVTTWQNPSSRAANAELVRWTASLPSPTWRLSFRVSTGAQALPANALRIEVYTSANFVTAVYTLPAMPANVTRVIALDTETAGYNSSVPRLVTGQAGMGLVTGSSGIGPFQVSVAGIAAVLPATDVRSIANNSVLRDIGGTAAAFTVRGMLNSARYLSGFSNAFSLDGPGYVLLANPWAGASGTYTLAAGTGQIYDVRGTIAASTTINSPIGRRRRGVRGTIAATGILPSPAALIRANVRGTLAGQTSISGRLTASFTASGTINAQAAISAAPRRVRNLRGTISPTASLDAKATIQSSAKGTISASTTLSAPARAIFPTQGTIAASGIVQGNAVRKPITYSVTGTIAARGQITGGVVRQRDVSGTITGTTSVEGTAARRINVRGTIAATSVVDAEAQRVLAPAQGTIVVTSGLSGAAGRVRESRGTIAASTTVSGPARRIRQVRGAIAATPSVTGTGRAVRAGSGTIAASTSLTARALTQSNVPGTPPSPDKIGFWTSVLERGVLDTAFGAGWSAPPALFLGLLSDVPSGTEIAMPRIPCSWLVEQNTARNVSDLIFPPLPTGNVTGIGLYGNESGGELLAATYISERTRRPGDQLFVASRRLTFVLD
jgi:hypothetical protein